MAAKKSSRSTRSRAPMKKMSRKTLRKGKGGNTVGAQPYFKVKLTDTAISGYS